ncbi:MAG: hypothetical protein AAGJ87_11280 [Pseudomonadota bacterium]
MSIRVLAVFCSVFQVSCAMTQPAPFLSNRVDDCGYSIQRLETPRFASDRRARLESELSDAFGPRCLRQNLRIARYDMFLNAAARRRAAGEAIAAGAAGDFAQESPIEQRPACSRSAMPGGWFDPAELSNRNSPIVIEIDYSVDGTTRRFTTAYSPVRDLAAPLRRATLRVNATLEAAMEVAHQRIITQLAASDGL